MHSIKKGEYARRIAEGGPIGHVSLMDHYVNVRRRTRLVCSADELDIRQAR